MVIGKNFTSTDLKLSRLCRLPVRLKLPDLIMIMVTIDIMLVVVIIRMFVVEILMMTIEMMRMAYMSKSGRSRVRRSSYLRMNWDLVSNTQ